MAKKIYRKKMTNSGGGVCVLTGLAAVFALCASAGDYIAGAVYTQFYKKQVYDMSFDVMKYIENYRAAFVMAVFALIMFIWALTAAKGKKMGREFGWTGILMGLCLSIEPALAVWEKLEGSLISDYFKTDYDSDKFRGSVELAKDGLPVLAGLFILLAGLAVVIKVSGEDFMAEVPRADKKSEKSAKGEEGDARGFGGGTQEVQGLTGETKPATYSGTAEEAVVSEMAGESVGGVSQDKSAKKATVNLCPQCGELVGADELFCSNCGHKM